MVFPQFLYLVFLHKCKINASLFTCSWGWMCVTLTGNTVTCYWREIRCQFQNMSSELWEKSQASENFCQKLKKELTSLKYQLDQKIRKHFVNHLTSSDNICKHYTGFPTLFRCKAAFHYCCFIERLQLDHLWIKSQIQADQAVEDDELGSVNSGAVGVSRPKHLWPGKWKAPLMLYRLTAWENGW